MALAKLLIEDVLESLENGEQTELKGIAQKSKYFRDVSKAQIENTPPEQWKEDVQYIAKNFGSEDLVKILENRCHTPEQVQSLLSKIIKD